MTSRRHVIKQLAVTSTGMIFMPGIVGAVKLNALDPTPSMEELLMEFACTIAPGIRHTGICFIEIFNEKLFRFRRFKWILALDLRTRSARLFGTRNFSSLDGGQKQRVIQSALGSGKIIRQLYSGAIQIIQIGYYSGFREVPEGCPEIDYEIFPPGDYSYPEYENFLGRAITTNGNLS